MQNSVAMLSCPNPRCQAPNPQSHNFCLKCRTPLPKRYLWAVGEGIDSYQSGDILAGRYLLQGNRILLDTKPGLPPETMEEIPDAIAPYLKLSPYQLNIPQVYGLLTRTKARHTPEIFLLEQVPIYSGGVDVSFEGELMPELSQVWKTAPPLRQINWLWQMAQLWQPMSSEGVASSLLAPKLLRVEGSLVRLLELQLDNKTTPTLQELGQVWSQWAQEAHPAVANFIEKLAQQMIQGRVHTCDQLVALLDQGLADCGRSHSFSYQLITRSDTGPSRKRNEDSCYPPSGTAVNVTNGAGVNLAIVCDGIGGHEGGDVASSLAIDAIRQRVENLGSSSNLNPTTLSEELETSACAANDVISQRNDNEQRQDRQRMGTTLVMALAHAHEIYITHVGDSRAYRVTRTGCHQVTLDDDLASREVRLGYALYRDAVQQPTSGSLVQALGMGSSATLHPTVQRFVVDEDCIFLLCSDGLSDNDRVEQYWEMQILPILDGQTDLVTASQRLVELANTQNGHDNVTVALVHCQARLIQGNGQTEESLGQIESVPPPSVSLDHERGVSAATSQMRTQQLPSSPSSKRPWLLVICLLLLGLAGGFAYWWFTLGGDRQIANLQRGVNSPSTSASSSSSPSASADPTPSPVSSFKPGAIVQLKNATPAIVRRSQPQDSQNQSTIQPIPVTLPANSVLKLQAKDRVNSKDFWQVKVCSIPSGTVNSGVQTPKPPQPRSTSIPQKNNQPSTGSNSTSTPSSNQQLRLGDVASIEETRLASISKPYTSQDVAQLPGCAAGIGTATQ